ncbi:MAG TPA: hypothetical protein PK869_06055, partial [Candidatus Hydrogenedentes bacterium]|nr:hypothetical protein [Candidatus Hydrogenedentota bacterium]
SCLWSALFCFICAPRRIGIYLNTAAARNCFIVMQYACAVYLLLGINVLVFYTDWSTPSELDHLLKNSSFLLRTTAGMLVRAYIAGWGFTFHVLASLLTGFLFAVTHIAAKKALSRKRVANQSAPEPRL